jgi:hypothetical protein
MPIDHYNPVLSGMMTAYDLADRIRTRAMQEAQFKRLQQADVEQAQQRADERQRQQQTDQLADFKNRLALVEGGMRQATPTDIAESTAQRFQLDESGNLTPTGQIGTDIVNRMVPYGGKTYVAPSMEERLQQAKVLSDAETMAKVNQTQKLSDLTAMELPPALSEKLGLPAGMKVGPSVQDDIIRAIVGLAKPAAQTAPHYTTDDTGTVWRINGDGTKQNLGKVGKSKTVAAAGTAGGEGSVSLQRLKLAQQKQRTDELTDLEAREDKAAKSVTALRTKIIQEKDTKVKVAYAAQLVRAEAALQRIRQQKVDQGFTTAEDAGVAGATATTPAATVPPEPKTWEEYKRAKGGG